MRRQTYILAVPKIFLLSVFLLCGLLTGPVDAQPIETPRDSDKGNTGTASSELRDILNERSELRRDLTMLTQNVENLKRRLKKLDQLSELQQQLDRTIRKLEKTEKANNETDSRKLESNIESLEQQIDQTREIMEIETELQDRITEAMELKQQVDNLPKGEIITKSSRYLGLAIENLNKLKQVRTAIKNLDSPSEQRYDQLEQAIDELQERVDFDSELIERGFRFIEAVEDGQADETAELTEDIRDILDEMENQPRTQAIIPEAFIPTDTPTTESESLNRNGKETVLESGQYFIRQSWSQETDYPRPYYVNVPKGKQGQKFPVFIFLHGNGGNVREVMPILLRNRKKMASQYIMVFAQGYQESWNIVSERSKADDTGFIESIVLKIASYENVQKDNFSIMGASNGAALVNQMLIESKLPNIRNYISGVSPLNVWQHDGEQFKAKGTDNNYRKPTKPMTGKRLMNISGTNDELVPYDGGVSKHIPAKDGKLGFLPAEESTYLWAKQMGNAGEKLTSPSRREGQLEVFSYLEGDVVHYKVAGAGHGATHEISEEKILSFLEGSKKKTEK
jgi:polyhydroxybutyrate depolymerase